MKLLSKLFNRKAPEATPPGKEGIQENTALNVVESLALYEELIDAIVRQPERQERLKQLITKAFSHPGSFFDEDNDFILSDRGLTYPEHAHLTPKFVLVDKMMEDFQMAEIDWKEEEENIRYSIDRVIKAKQYPVNLSLKDKYGPMEPDSILQQISSAELEPQGYVLTVIDIDADSYVFTVIPAYLEDRVLTIFNAL